MDNTHMNWKKLPEQAKTNKISFLDELKKDVLKIKQDLISEYSDKCQIESIEIDFIKGVSISGVAIDRDALSWIVIDLNAELTRLFKKYNDKFFFVLLIKL